MQEGLAWKHARALINRLQPAFALAVITDPALASQYPSLSRLFGALKAIAQQGAAVRRANAKLELAGKAPYKGKVGKRRKQVDAAAALEALTTSARGAPPAPAPLAPPAPQAV